MTQPWGVSFIVPVHNGRRWLPSVIDAIRTECHGRPAEVIVVDDGGSDGSGRWLRAEARGALTIVPGPRRGAAAAVNTAIREARYPIICQVDQDVVIQQGWLSELLEALREPDVAAAQGRYITGPAAGFWARVMGRDLEWRYARMPGPFTDHVCTGNTAYRASALHAVGLLDETLGYGYDNDLSYRLTNAGYRLAFVRTALSVHHWREGAVAYLRQQFGLGYGRLDVVRRHPSRLRGDRVSNGFMMAQAPLTLAALAALVLGACSAALGYSPKGFASLGLGVIALLLMERSIAGVAAWRHTGDYAALAFPAAHLARNLAWALAIVLWTMRRVTRRSPSPAHSMQRSESSRLDDGRPVLTFDSTHGKLLAIVPAYNEAESLPRVVGELRTRAQGVDVLVVNDGSNDTTAELLPELGVKWLTLPARVGVGGAVRAGLRYAVSRGYSYVVRIDGDGQHRAADIKRLLAPVAADRLYVVIGSRFMGRRRRPTLLRSAQLILAACLSAATGRKITDPTSGFCLFGPRALRLLARHHPTGYAEPELILLLHRNGLRAGEQPIRTRPRLKGRTSLTPGRAFVACGRTLLALLVVPARRVVADRSES